MDKRERVARAIFDASTFYGEWDRQPKANQEVCHNMADAAIAALEPVTVQKTYGRTKVSKQRAAVQALRDAIRAEGTLAIQDAWDRAEPWVDRIFKP